jgi:hypothetical protein
MELCDEYSDTREVKNPVSDSKRELNVKGGYAGRALYTTTF